MGVCLEGMYILVHRTVILMNCVTFFDDQVHSVSVPVTGCNM